MTDIWMSLPGLIFISSTNSQNPGTVSTFMYLLTALPGFNGILKSIWAVMIYTSCQSAGWSGASLWTPVDPTFAIRISNKHAVIGGGHRYDPLHHRSDGELVSESAKKVAFARVSPAWRTEVRQLKNWVRDRAKWMDAQYLAPPRWILQPGHCA